MPQTKATAYVSHNAHGRVITVLSDVTHETLFQTLDDGFGMERARSWAKGANVILATEAQKEWELGA